MLRKFIPNSIVNKLKHFPTAVAANIRYGFPSKSLTIIGVTGTDGKTTTVNMIYQILKHAGKKVAVVSTVNAKIGNTEVDTGFHVTSPTHFDMQKYIYQSKQNGCEFLILEVSSFALSQYRVWGIKFDIGVITNITHEHLDYHKSWENYFLAKAKLIKNSRVAVLNRDENHFFRLKKIASGEVVSFGLSKKADFNPSRFPLSLKIPGKFNIMNAEAASAVAVNLGINRKEIQKSLSDFEAVKGRMNVIPNKLFKNIIIDYAHTPNGLKNALEALREQYTKSRLVAVIGAEGERDKSKRFPMGQIAGEKADYVIITAVDPRGSLDSINEDILKGAKKAGAVEGKNVFVETDRAKAIEMAIKDLAKPGDTIGIFGKGHEESMNFDGKKEVPWSDFKVVEQILGV